MFELDGTPITLQDLRDFAKDNNLDFESYLQSMKDSGMVEVGFSRDTTASGMGTSTLADPQDPTTTKFTDVISIAEPPSGNIIDFFKEIAKPREEKAYTEIEETDRLKGSYFAAQKHLAPFLGYDNPIANFFADGVSSMYRSGGFGVEAGEEVQPSRDVMGAGKDVTLEQAQAMIDLSGDDRFKEPTDNIRKYQSRYDQVAKEYGGIMAFMVGVAENPMYIRDVGVQSMAMMGSALANSSDVQQTALVAAPTVGLAAARTGKNPIGFGVGFMSGLFGSVSGTMDAGLSYQEFLAEGMKEDGLDFTPENVVKYLQNDEVTTYKDPNGLPYMDITGTRAEILKTRATRRGWAIGLTDTFTGVLSGGLAKGVLKKSTKLITRVARGVKGTGAAVGGGITSEVMGQSFGGQEYHAGEILTEGFAEKGIAMTGITVIPQMLKKKGTYRIGKEQMSEAKFMKEVNAMDDMTLAMADVQVENDAITERTLGLRQQNAILNTKIDARVRDPKDRKILIEKHKELQKAKKDAKKEGIFTVPGAEKKKKAIEEEIAKITNKYANIDPQSKEVRETKAEYEKVIKAVGKTIARKIIKDKASFAKTASKMLGFKGMKLYNNEESYIGAYVQEKMADYMSELSAEEVKNMSDREIETISNQYAEQAVKTDGVMLTTEADGSKRIMINVERAAEIGAINVAQHEVLHGVLKMALSKMETPDKKKLIAGFKQQIKTHFGEKIVGEIEGRILSEYKGEIKQDSDFVSTTDEWFTMLSDIVDDQYRTDVTWNEVSQDHKNFFEKMKDFIPPIFRKKTPYKKLSIATGEDAFNFMKEYSKNIKEGKLSEGMVAFAKGEGPTTTRKTKDLFSRTKDNAPFVNELASMLPDKAAWDGTFGKFKSGSEYVIDEIIRNKYFDQLIASTLKVPRSEKETKNFVKKVYSELTQHIKNFNPEQNNNLFAYINSQVRNKAGVVYNRELKKDPALKDAKDINATTPEGAPVTQIAAEPTPDFDVDVDTKPIPKSERERVLRDFDIELDDGSFDAELTAEVEALIEENPDNLQERFDNLIEKDLRKKLDNAVGKVQKIDGKTFISPEYEAFIRNEYSEIVQSLGIKQIRTAYKNWFEKKKVGTEDVKKVDRITGKTTYFRKGIFENTTNKPKYIKYFTQGGFTTLRERRNALLKRIARKKAENAVDNYIQTNSNNIDAVVKAKFRQLSKASDNVINEKKSFDTVKFSRSVEEAYKEIFDQIEYDVSEGRWVGYTNPHSKESQTFPDLGRVWEQAYANFFIDMNIGGLEVLSEIAGEKGGMADFVLRYADRTENHELKAGLVGPWMGSVMLGFKDNKITLTKDTQQNLITKEVETKVKEALKQKIDRLNEGIDALNKETEVDSFNEKKLKRPIFPRIDLKKILEGGKTQYVPWHLMTSKHEKNPIGFDLDGQSLLIVEANEQPIINHYLNKETTKDGVKSLNPVTSASFIGTPEHGNISVRFSNDSMLNLPMFKAKTNVHIGFRHRTKTIDGYKMRAVVVGMQYKVTELLNTPDEILDIANKADLLKMLPVNNVSKPINKTKTISKAISKARTESFSRSSEGITVLDFDDTLATTESLVRFTAPDGTKGTLNAEQYASQYQGLLEKGYKFDFTEFNKVVKAKLAPLFNKALKLQKKFGPENMFILTARPPAAQQAIFDFLQANGLNIPIKNITGLGNSTAEAKALWIAEKVGEGYNDFYFADDALQNTQAVQNMLDQFDVKSKVQQAKVKFSRSMDKDFNNILEELTGIDSEKRFSAIKARKRGADKGKFRFFIPPSHEDFVGLLYNFMGKGKKGNEHRNFFEKALVRPLNRAYRELNTAKQSIANDYKSLNEQFPNIKSVLNEKVDEDFTVQDAIRIYLWDKHGHKIPGLSETDQQALSEFVMSERELKNYAETLNMISKQDTYVSPTESWEIGDIRTDLDDATGRIGRAEFFTEFNENAEIVFSEKNLNKIEAAYGSDVVSAIKDILYRTKTGRNRPSGQNKIVNAFMNYLNGSVAATMFVNIRSMVLQQMSMVNFINYGDNNVFKAGLAFANQPQYYKDWAYIFNSDFMKQRRGGIKTDVNGAELAASLRGAKNTPRALLAKLLQLGFLPTQIGDNFAIATGGAPFYRNRINTYIKQGLSQKEAQEKAWIDFQALAEATQQSARPDMVSQQQASPLGKVILAFQNVTSQFNRIGKKAFLDIKNRRITPGNTTQFQSDVSNTSRIAYYFAIQNLIFYSLQSALFTMMFDDDEDDKRWLKKKERVINGSIDSVLRGTGVWGAVVATLKNMAIKRFANEGKDWNADPYAVMAEGLQVSPPLGIKARKSVQAERDLIWKKDIIDEMETFDIDNPMWSAYTSHIESLTNIPVNRLYNKTQNVRQSLNNQHEAYQRALMFSGWSQWNLGIENEKMEKVKQDIKDKKAEEKKKKKKGKGKGKPRKSLFNLKKTNLKKTKF